MKRRYGIGLFAAGVFVALSLAYHLEYKYDQKMVQEAKKQETEAQENVISAQGEAKKEEIFYLAELNGYVVVYRNDKNTVYEYTDILVDELPGDLKEKIREGIRMEGTEKLYGFLENYTS